MQEISNSLRQRLGARPRPQTHPDPDVLTAYVERVLAPAERADVVMHLAECNDCREVVALSLSQLPVEAEVQTAAGRSRFWVPAFQWAGALAVLAVAAALVIEKPWHRMPAVQTQAEFSQAAPRVAPTTAASTPSALSAVTSASSEPARARAEHSSATGSDMLAADKTVVRADLDEAGRQRMAPAKTPSGVATAELKSPGSAPPPAPTATRATLTREAMATVDLGEKDTAQSQARDASSDYVNRNLFKNDNSTNADAKQLPQTPGPQGSAQAATSYAAFPPLSVSDALSNADHVRIAPPTIAASGSRPVDPTTLKSSRGWTVRGARKVGGIVAGGLHKAEAGMGGFTLDHSSGFASGNLATPNAKLGDNDSENKTESYTQWRISDGTLMRSTDSTQWHLAYPQSSNLQLKVVVTKDDQVWAGGNNATIIHSWNSGVNWETLKVPDSGDITAITIDEGWQVKTSNGQTFVSQDHGKTWVPLQGEK